uniref:ABC transmembrane type-2 domain-containing protein n=1 Tax=Gloeochaete wittrockiana TaxID=38269 RepID=A0A3G1IW29_9EUKA|nr:hypothetical protein [Gloeochaete wittrockiana]ASQ40250.1 hypothetical protein [Gloeochaete wittrockiana]
MKELLNTKPTYFSSTDPSIKQLLQEVIALTNRLFRQLKHRPINGIIGLIQPMIWIFFFGPILNKLNQDTGIFVSGSETHYFKFFFPGILIFTLCNGALNSGLPLIFDKEFGFLNRILVSPLNSRLPIFIANFIYTTSICLLQSLIITQVGILIQPEIIELIKLNSLTILIIISIFIFSLSSISLGLALLLPSHIELIAILFVINMPLLFSSPILIPLNMMPLWLKYITILNPITYTIEVLRFLYNHDHWTMSDTVFNCFSINFSFFFCLSIIFLFAYIVYTTIKILLNRIYF